MSDLTRLTDCVFFLQGQCNKGSSCMFRHCDGALWNLRVCRNWLQGNCAVEDCVFRHPTPTWRSRTDKDRAKVPCYWLSHGGCQKADKCPFFHTAPFVVIDGVAQPGNGKVQSTKLSSAQETASPQTGKRAGAASVEDGAVAKKARSTPFGQSKPLISAPQGNSQLHVRSGSGNGTKNVLTKGRTVPQAGAQSAGGKRASAVVALKPGAPKAVSLRGPGSGAAAASSAKSTQPRTVSLAGKISRPSTSTVRVRTLEELLREKRAKAAAAGAGSAERPAPASKPGAAQVPSASTPSERPPSSAVSSLPMRSTSGNDEERKEGKSRVLQETAAPATVRKSVPPDSSARVSASDAQPAHTAAPTPDQDAAKTAPSRGSHTEEDLDAFEKELDEFRELLG